VPSDDDRDSEMLEWLPAGRLLAGHTGRSRVV